MSVRIGGKRLRRTGVTRRYSRCVALILAFSIMLCYPLDGILSTVGIILTIFIAQQQDELFKLRKDHTALQSKFASSTQSYERTLEKTKLQLEGSQSSYNDLERKHSDLERRHIELERDYTSVKSQLEKWQNLGNEEGKEAEKARKEAEKVAKEVAKERKEREKLEDEVKALRKEVEELRDGQEDAEKSKKDRKAMKRAVADLAVCFFLYVIITGSHSCIICSVHVARESGCGEQMQGAGGTIGREGGEGR